MRGKKLAVLTAMLVLIGGLSGCGKGTTTNKNIPPSTVCKQTNVSLKTGASESKSAATTTKTGQKCTIILNNGENGEASLSKIEGTTGDKAKVFVRPNYGYQPDKVLLNDQEVSGTKGNYEVILAEGENKIDVSYKRIKPILETPASTYKDEFALMKLACDDTFLVYDDVDKFIGVNNMSAAYVQNIELEVATCATSLVLEENNTTGKFNVTSIIGTATHSIKYETVIDGKTFNENIKYEDLNATSTLMNPLVANAQTNDVKKLFEPIFVNAIDTLIKKFSCHDGFPLKFDFYNLGFYHYPGRFEVEYLPEEYINKNTTVEYASEVAEIRNFSRSKYNIDSYMYDYRMSGIEDYIYLDKLGSMNDVVILLFKDRIRFLYHDELMINYLHGGFAFMSIDVPNDGGEKIRITGFCPLLTDRNIKPLKTSTISAHFETFLDGPISISDFKFNLTNREVVTIYHDADNIEHKDEIVLTKKELNILNNRLTYCFKFACINFTSGVSGYDFKSLNVIKAFTAEEALKYQKLNFSLDNSKEIYKAWHQDLNKLIRGIDGKDETTTDLVELSLKDIKLPAAAQEMVNRSNTEIPNVILRSENNRIQFGIQYKGNPSKFDKTCLITLPDEDQTSFEIEEVVLLSKNHVETDYYHRTINLNTWTPEENPYPLLKCYDPSSINSDLTIKPESAVITPKITDKYSNEAEVRELFKYVLVTLFNGFGDINLYLSFGLDQCQQNLYLIGEVEL